MKDDRYIQRHREPFERGRIPISRHCIHVQCIEDAGGVHKLDNPMNKFSFSGRFEKMASRTTAPPPAPTTVRRLLERTDEATYKYFGETRVIGKCFEVHIGLGRDQTKQDSREYRADLDGAYMKLAQKLFRTKKTREPTYCCIHD